MNPLLIFYLHPFFCFFPFLLLLFFFICPPTALALPSVTAVSLICLHATHFLLPFLPSSILCLLKMPLSFVSLHHSFFPLLNFLCPFPSPPLPSAFFLLIFLLCFWTRSGPLIKPVRFIIYFYFVITGNHYTVYNHYRVYILIVFHLFYYSIPSSFSFHIFPFDPFSPVASSSLHLIHSLLSLAFAAPPSVIMCIALLLFLPILASSPSCFSPYHLPSLLPLFSSRRSGCYGNFMLCQSSPASYNKTLLAGGVRMNGWGGWGKETEHGWLRASSLGYLV